MNILFVGDIVGRPGRQILDKHLKSVKKEHDIDFTIVNGENAAHGKGITLKTFNQLLTYGADVVTMGNHTYSKDAILDFVDHEQLVVPINYDKETEGHGYRVYDVNDKKVMVANVCTQAFMNNVKEGPIDASKVLLDVDADVKIIDLHGEATAEKIAYMHYYKKDFSAVLGTHTHVQTADEDVFDGCAYISDVGMCGGYLSVIGRDVDEVIHNITTGEKTHYTVAKTPAIFNAVVIKICDKTNRALDIKRIQIRP